MIGITKVTLDLLLTKHISDFCTNGYANYNDNHCAHFVSHVLGFRFGFKCGDMIRGTGPSVCIRVHELFKQCPVVGNWSEKPIVLIYCLAFITNSSNVDLATKTMVNVPSKHVGIFYNGFIYHYSGTGGQVVRQTPEEFSGHYKAPSNSIFYGTVPFVLNL